MCWQTYWKMMQKSKLELTCTNVRCKSLLTKQEQTTEWRWWRGSPRGTRQRRKEFRPRWGRRRPPRRRPTSRGRRWVRMCRWCPETRWGWPTCARPQIRPQLLHRDRFLFWKSNFLRPLKSFQTRISDLNDFKGGRNLMKRCLRITSSKTRCQFHQRSMSIFYTRRLTLTLLGATHLKAARKYAGEIDGRWWKELNYKGRTNTLGLYFINVKCTSFLYKRHFGSFFWLFVDIVKAAEMTFIHKRARIMLMKLTAGNCILKIHEFCKWGQLVFALFLLCQYQKASEHDNLASNLLL